VNRISWLYAFLLVGFLNGCATRDDVLILDRRTSSLEQQVWSVRDSLDGLKTTLSKRMDQAEKKMDSTLKPVHQSQANTLAQMDELKSQIQSLQGRIEAYEYNQKKDQQRLSESLVKDLKDLQTKIQRIEQSPTPSKPTPKQVSSAEGEDKAEKRKEAPQEEEKEGKEPAKEKGNTKAKSEGLYGEAEALFKKKAFEEAQKKYEDYLKIDPKGKYAEEARFGLAESLFGAKNYEEAILAYQKLIKSYPKGKYVPEALYKQALSFLNLKDNGSARLLLEKIVKNYPKTNQAKLAQKKLKTL